MTQIIGLELLGSRIQKPASAEEERLRFHEGEKTFTSHISEKLNLADYSVPLSEFFSLDVAALPSHV